VVKTEIKFEQFDKIWANQNLASPKTSDFLQLSAQTKDAGFPTPATREVLWALDFLKVP